MINEYTGMILIQLLICALMGWFVGDLLEYVTGKPHQWSASLGVFVIVFYLGIPGWFMLFRAIKLASQVE